ncbi:MAG: polyphenol oxidase family protein [Massilia sp.]
MITSPLLDELAPVVHGFGTRGDRMAELFPAWWAKRPIQHERHGTRIAVVERAGEDCGEADGMFTDKPGLLLSIATADCAPVLLARWDGRQVAALHVGWRGALGGIVGQFASLLHERGGNPADWVAAVGPAAGPCCYEVPDELVGQFHARHGIPTGLVAPRRGWLNLPGIVNWQLKRAGFGAVSACPECTICHPGTPHGFAFHSYRRDRETRTPMVDVQWSVIAIANSRGQNA